MPNSAARLMVGSGDIRITSLLNLKKKKKKQGTLSLNKNKIKKIKERCP